jgi:exopolysaccharide biosynthesis protein
MKTIITTIVAILNIAFIVVALYLFIPKEVSHAYEPKPETTKIDLLHMSEDEIRETVYARTELKSTIKNEAIKGSNITYADEIEELIETRPSNGDSFKYESARINGHDAHLLIVYDPKTIKLITSKAFNTEDGVSGKSTLLEMTKRSGAKAAVNGGGFYENEHGGLDKPKGYVIKDGEIIWRTSDGAGDLIGFNEEGKLMLLHATGEEAIEQGMVDALEFGPFLVNNGKAISYKATVGGFTRAARVAVGQRSDGIVIFLMVEGLHGSGITLNELAKAMVKYGAFTAANLDGGASAQVVIEGKLVSKATDIKNNVLKDGRGIVTGWGIFGNN